MSILKWCMHSPTTGHSFLWIVGIFNVVVPRIMTNYHGGEGAPNGRSFIMGHRAETSDLPSPRLLGHARSNNFSTSLTSNEKWSGNIRERIKDHCPKWSSYWIRVALKYQRMKNFSPFLSLTENNNTQRLRTDLKCWLKKEIVGRQGSSIAASLQLFPSSIHRHCWNWTLFDRARFLKGIWELSDWNSFRLKTLKFTFPTYSWNKGWETLDSKKDMRFKLRTKSEWLCACERIII